MRYSLDDIRGKDVLLVASTGGHLTQLTRLAPRLGVGEGSRWVTFDTPQSRSLLAGQDVTYVPYVSPRDWRNILRALVITWPLQRQYAGAVSTGAGLALSVLPFVLLRRHPSVFIESISRVTGPSLSGRVLAHLPWVGLYAQHAWAAAPWRRGPSVLSTYEAEPPAADAELALPRRIYVTLGTIQPYRFDRLVDLVRDWAAAHPGTEVRWQVGCTTRDDLSGEVSTEMPSADFLASIMWADAVVAHAGVGVSMSILDAGKVPILLAREVARGEHVDEHQRQIFDFLVSRGLAADASCVFRDDRLLARACATSVREAAAPAPAPTDPIDDSAPEDLPVDTTSDKLGPLSSVRQHAQDMMVRAGVGSQGLRDLLRPLHRRVAGALPLRLRRQYLYMAAGFPPAHLDNPRTYNEKINWRILHDRRPEIIRACDKLEMKAMAREKVPDEKRLRIPETWWIGSSVDDIPGELLQREAVLKPNDGSGEVIFLPASREEVRERTRGWLTGELSRLLGEWGYGHAAKVMLIEERIPVQGTPPDYKFNVFEGRARKVEVHTGRFDNHLMTWFDRDGTVLDLRAPYLPRDPDAKLPEHIDEMLELADELGSGWDYIRVDFYEAEGQIWFGEFSPYQGGGVERFVPGSFDAQLGGMWTLPRLNPSGTATEASE